MHRQSYLLFFVAILFVIIVTALIGVLVLSRPRSVSLQQQSWSDESPLIAVEKITASSPALSVYRAVDAKEERLEGNWNYYFVSPTELFVYGFFENTPATQRFFILTPNGGFIKNISTLPGQITNITQNKGKTHLLLTGVAHTPERPEGYVYNCLSLKNISDTIQCVFVREDIIGDASDNKNTVYRASWSSTDDFILTIYAFGAEKLLYTYDVIGHGFVTQTSTESYLAEKLDLKAESDETVMFSPKDVFVLRLPFLTAIFRKTSRTLTLFRSNKNDELVWLDDTHVLIVSDLKSHILNVQTRKKSFFVDLPERDFRIITTHPPLDQ